MKRGNKPKCKGCGRIIERESSRFVHVFHERANHKWKTEHTYCDDAGCFFNVEDGKGMKRKHIEQIVVKRTANPEVTRMKKLMRERLEIIAACEKDSKKKGKKSGK